MTEYKLSALGMGDKDLKWTKIKNYINE